MSFGGLFVPGMESFSQFLGLSSDLHDVFGSLFEAFECGQASSHTDPMLKRVKRASLTSSQVAASPRLERMTDQVAPMRSWHHVILLLSSSTSPS